MVPEGAKIKVYHSNSRGTRHGCVSGRAVKWDNAWGLFCNEDFDTDNYQLIVLLLLKKPVKKKKKLITLQHYVMNFDIMSTPRLKFSDCTYFLCPDKKVQAVF